MSDRAAACTVTYVETPAAAADDARRILAGYAAARTDTPGLRAVDLLARDGVAGQFVLVEAGDEGAVGPDAAAAARDAALAPLLLAPCDVRRHVALAVGAAGAAAPHGAIWVVTHVDVVPAHKDEGVAQVVRLADSSRAEPGCLRFDAWQQADRPNHMTLVETWADPGARDDHRAAAATRRFRERLAPLSGALYDERLCRRA